MNKNRGKWTKNDDKKLMDLFKQGLKVKQIARVLGRTYAATNTRLSQLRKNGALDEKRGASNGPNQPATGERGPKEVLPTGEEAAAIADEVAEMQQAISDADDIIKQMKERAAERRANAIVLQRENNQLRKQLEGKGINTSKAKDEFLNQLQRENAALRAALVASNNVIAVYTTRGEDSDE
jgi:regulator of replication initiation timing